MDWFLNREEYRLRAGWRLLLQFVMMFFFLGIGYYLTGFLSPELGFLLRTVVGMAAFTLSVWIAVRYLDERTFQQLGIRWNSGWIREIGVGLAIGALAMGIIFLIQLSSGWIRLTGFGWERAWSIPYPLPLLGYLVGMLMVGFYEELVFRGYQITNMTEGLTGERFCPEQAVILAMLISSVIFGSMHFGNSNATVTSTINIIMAGVVLSVPYVLTGSLGIPIGLHTSWNFFQGGIFGFPVSGSPTRSSLLQIRETGPDFITGGGFGPEAGLMGALGSILILALSYAYILKSQGPVQLHEKFKNKKQN